MLVASFSLGAAALDDEGKKMTKAEKRLANVMKKYEYTGKERSCVPLRNLKHQKIIDDKTIFFESQGGRAYMNKMDRKCPRLAYEQRFAFKTSINQLCSLDIITVIDSFGRDWAGCGLGKFHEMKRIPKEERMDKETK